MGIPDGSILDLIEKVRSWLSWGGRDLSGFSGEFEMSNSSKMCSECESSFTDSCIRYRCQCCGRLLCRNCMLGYENPLVDVPSAMKSSGKGEKLIRSCKFCSYEIDRKFSGKIYPSVSPRASPEPPSPTYLEGRIDGTMNRDKIKKDCFPGFLEAHEHCESPHSATCSSLTSFSGHPSPVAFRRTSSRSDEEETEDSASQYFSQLSEYCQDDVSDIDTSSISARNDFYSFKSVGSSSLDSPFRNNYTSTIVERSVQREQGESPKFQNDTPFDQETMAILERPEIKIKDTENTNYCANDSSKFSESYPEKPLDFENNGLIWLPPPPEDENDEIEDSFFQYDDEDDDIGEAGAVFSSCSSLPSIFPAKEKPNEGNKEPLKAVVKAHFRALVSQLLQGEGIKTGDDYIVEDWLDIVTTLAWEAANCVKPDTSRGGSMDPGDYVKVKCVATGKPSESTFIKGVVCTKNIKHKRMTSQYKNPRLLLLGGALEYQRVPNQLASFDTLLEQENDHLKMIISKIEAHRTNVLLVEKSVSSYAQEYLLEKEISLVLNVKRPLLERIARCTGASVTPTIESISTAKLGHCELFRLERLSEDLETSNQSNKKLSKTLMFFEGCSRRLGCTILLKGACRQELKKLKHVVQYAVFAAYHLSLETSFLADEGASLPKINLKPSVSVPLKEADEELSAGFNLQVGGEELSPEAVNPTFDAVNHSWTSNLGLEVVSFDTSTNVAHDARHHLELTNADKVNESKSSSEYFSGAESHQSILVSFSSRCVLKGTLCERSRLLRIKFYGCFDKPLGRYLHDDLFDQAAYCQSCNELAEAHLQCFTHQQGSLTISVRRLPNLKLPCERDGKIWMWHRCLRCALIDGIPPATRRVVMSDAAWGLSFGKFLELSFSNHATANRVATCGHSLQRDCLRYYGFGSMVAFFHYTPIDILSVHLPPSMIEFSSHLQQDWIRKEAEEIFRKIETLYTEIGNVLTSMEQKSASSGQEELHNHIIELKVLVEKERNDYDDLMLQATVDPSLPGQLAVDILELNHVRRSLIICSHVWDRRLYSLDSLLKTRGSNLKEIRGYASYLELKDWKNESSFKEVNVESDHENVQESINLQDSKNEISIKDVPEESLPSLCPDNKEQEPRSDEKIFLKNTCQESTSHGSSLSDKIDIAWTGTGQLQVKSQAIHVLQADGSRVGIEKQLGQIDNISLERVKSPLRVYSFDSATRVQDRIRKGFSPSSLHLSTFRSFHAYGEYRNMIRDPVSRVLRTYSQLSPRESQKLCTGITSTPSLIASVSQMSEGARLLLPQTGESNIVIAVYDEEPTSIISYALSSTEYEDLIADKSSETNLDYAQYGSYGFEDASSTKKSLHLRITFGDDSLSAGGKVKFSVTCYFAKQFDTLRKKCCPTEVDFLRSMSRCKRWSAQGGKSNVYFAKSLDERFIIKQLTKTELDSFEEFAPEYFKYLSDSLSSGSPTCLAKIVGIYQVTVKHLKGGKETKMELMVMENLFFKRNISRVYDLKGSARSRYNPDTTGANTVLLDTNLLETLRTKPIFLGSKSKRSLERAVWNDTSFLASVDVMDYSLLVGVDEERKELVLGIIDIMRQYTWDKHLETWVKASGILGGPKNASPTIISPKQYKRRFRKAMTTYFLTVPDQWP